MSTPGLTFYEQLGGCSRKGEDAYHSSASGPCSLFLVESELLISFVILYVFFFSYSMLWLSVLNFMSGLCPWITFVFYFHDNPGSLDYTLTLFYRDPPLLKHLSQFRIQWFFFLFNAGSHYKISCKRVKKLLYVPNSLPDGFCALVSQSLLFKLQT